MTHRNGLTPRSLLAQGSEFAFAQVDGPHTRGVSSGVSSFWYSLLFGASACDQTDN
jgi:hypothetical protein